jgi:Protease inhibitor Inh
MNVRATLTSEQGWRCVRRLGVALLLASAAGCAERVSLGSGSTTASTEPLAAAPTDRVAAAPLATPSGPRGAPPVNMSGRWTLNSPGAGTCAMNFAGAQGAAEGTIAPEGGCPGNFFTSRKWVFEPEGLVIRDHTGKSLAQLAVVSPSRLDGQATGGQPVMLAR